MVSKIGKAGKHPSGPGELLIRETATALVESSKVAVAAE